MGMLKTDWPATLPTAINAFGRVAGHEVNAHDDVLYRVDTRASGDFPLRLAETKLPPTLVLHTAPQRRSLLWGEETREAPSRSLNCWAA